MSLCVHCATEIPEGVHTCPQCGKRIGGLLWSPLAQIVLLLGAIGTGLGAVVLGVVGIAHLADGRFGPAVGAALVLVHTLAMLVVILRARAAAPP